MRCTLLLVALAVLAAIASPTFAGSDWSTQQQTAIASAKLRFYEQVAQLEKQRYETLVEIERKAKAMPVSERAGYQARAIDRVQDNYHAMLDDLIDYYGEVLARLHRARSEREAVALIKAIKS